MSQAEGLQPCVCIQTAYPSVQRETLRCERFNDCLSCSLTGLEACTGPALLDDADDIIAWRFTIQPQDFVDPSVVSTFPGVGMTADEGYTGNKSSV